MSAFWIVIICSAVFAPAILWLAWMHGYDKGQRDNQHSQKLIRGMPPPFK